MAGRIAAAKAFYSEVKYEVWDTLSPAARNRIVGGWKAFEGAAMTSITMAVFTYPHPPFKTIGMTALVTGYVALKNYLAQPNRIPLTDAERAKLNAGS